MGTILKGVTGALLRKLSKNTDENGATLGILPKITNLIPKSLEVVLMLIKLVIALILTTLYYWIMLQREGERIIHKDLRKYE